MTKSTDIEKAPEAGALEAYDFGDVDDGLDAVVANFGPVIPRIVTNGKFGYPAMTDEPTGQVIEEGHYTILGSTVGRAWWEGDKPEKGKAPDCRSFDCITADPNSPNLQNGGDCITCPLAEFGPDNERPDCKQSAQVLVYDHENEGFRVLRVSGTSIKKFNKYVQAFRTSKKLGRAFEWVTTVGSEVVADNYDKHNELTFKNEVRLAPEDVRNLLAARDQIGWQQRLSDDLAREETATSAGAVGDNPEQYGKGEEPFE